MKKQVQSKMERASVTRQPSEGAISNRVRFTIKITATVLVCGILILTLPYLFISLMTAINGSLEMFPREEDADLHVVFTIVSALLALVDFALIWLLRFIWKRKL